MVKLEAIPFQLFGHDVNQKVKGRPEFSVPYDVLDKGIKALDKALVLFWDRHTNRQWRQLLSLLARFNPPLPFLPFIRFNL
jgi:hypothetical protein